MKTSKGSIRFASAVAVAAFLVAGAVSSAAAGESRAELSLMGGVQALNKNDTSLPDHFVNVPAVATVLGFRRLLPPESIGAIVAEAAVVGLVYLASAFAFGLRSSERARYFDYVRRLVAVRSSRLIPDVT